MKKKVIKFQFLVAILLYCFLCEFFTFGCELSLMLVALGFGHFVWNESPISDQRQDEDQGHDSDHESESCPRTERVVEVGDADWTKETGQTTSSGQDAHPGALQSVQYGAI